MQYKDNPDELVPEETFTHSHLSWSSVIPYLVPPSIAIHGILPVQFTCMTVFLHNLCPTFLWFTSTWPGTFNFKLRKFPHPIIVFFSQYTPLRREQRYIISSHVRIYAASCRRCGPAASQSLVSVSLGYTND